MVIKEYNESYHKDRSIMTADQLEVERSLWSYLSEEDLVFTPIEGSKVILFQDISESQLKLQI